MQAQQPASKQAIMQIPNKPVTRLSDSKQQANKQATHFGSTVVKQPTVSGKWFLPPRGALCSSPSPSSPVPESESSPSLVETTVLLVCLCQSACAYLHVPLRMCLSAIATACLLACLPAYACASISVEDAGQGMVHA